MSSAGPSRQPLLAAPPIDILGIPFGDHVTGEPVSSSPAIGFTCTASVASSRIAEGEHKHLHAISVRDLTGAFRNYVFKHHIPYKDEYAHAPPLGGPAKAIHDEQGLLTT